VSDLTTEALGSVLTSIVSRSEAELLTMTEAELADRWFFKWDEKRSIEWNTYKFSDMLEMHKRSCRQWEERHNGGCCVVERVRDKYLMPRVREFLADLAKHQTSE
jgi:hypothetical protein